MAIGDATAGAQALAEIDRLAGHVDRLTAKAAQLEAEIDAMRPVVDSMVRVVELDEICDQHPGISDPAGQKAEADLYEAVRDRTRAVDAYRARKS